MTLEIELIEQLADEPVGRPLLWTLEFLTSRGHAEPLVMLTGMWRGGQLQLSDEVGAPLQPWQAERTLRTGDELEPVRVQATTKGMRWAFGQ